MESLPARTLDDLVIEEHAYTIKFIKSLKEGEVEAFKKEIKQLYESSVQAFDEYGSKLSQMQQVTARWNDSMVSTFLETLKRYYDDLNNSRIKSIRSEREQISRLQQQEQGHGQEQFSDYLLRNLSFVANVEKMIPELTKIQEWRQTAKSFNDLKSADLLHRELFAKFFQSIIVPYYLSAYEKTVANDSLSEAVVELFDLSLQSMNTPFFRQGKIAAEEKMEYAEKAAELDFELIIPRFMSLSIPDAKDRANRFIDYHKDRYHYFEGLSKEKKSQGSDDNDESPLKRTDKSKKTTFESPEGVDVGGMGGDFETPRKKTERYNAHLDKIKEKLYGLLNEDNYQRPHVEFLVLPPMFPNYRYGSNLDRSYIIGKDAKPSKRDVIDLNAAYGNPPELWTISKANISQFANVKFDDMQIGETSDNQFQNYPTAWLKIIREEIEYALADVILQSGNDVSPVVSVYQATVQNSADRFNWKKMFHLQENDVDVPDDEDTGKWTFKEGWLNKMIEQFLTDKRSAGLPRSNNPVVIVIPMPVPSLQMETNRLAWNDFAQVISDVPISIPAASASDTASISFRNFNDNATAVKEKCPGLEGARIVSIVPLFCRLSSRPWVGLEEDENSVKLSNEFSNLMNTKTKRGVDSLLLYKFLTGVSFDLQHSSGVIFNSMINNAFRKMRDSSMLAPKSLNTLQAYDTVFKRLLEVGYRRGAHFIKAAGSSSFSFPETSDVVLKAMEARSPPALTRSVPVTRTAPKTPVTIAQKSKTGVKATKSTASSEKEEENTSSSFIADRQTTLDDTTPMKTKKNKANESSTSTGVKISLFDLLCGRNESFTTTTTTTTIATTTNNNDNKENDNKIQEKARTMTKTSVDDTFDFKILEVASSAAAPVGSNPSVVTIPTTTKPTLETDLLFSASSSSHSTDPNVVSSLSVSHLSPTSMEMAVSAPNMATGHHQASPTVDSGIFGKNSNYPEFAKFY